MTELFIQKIATFISGCNQSKYNLRSSYTEAITTKIPEEDAAALNNNKHSFLILESSPVTMAVYASHMHLSF